MYLFIIYLIIPHPQCGVVRFEPQLFSSPGTLLLARSSPRSSLECPAPVCPRVPSPRVSLECPTPESPWSAQPQSVPGVPSPRVSLECPTPRVSLPREGGDVRSKILYLFFFKHCHPFGLKRTKYQGLRLRS